MSGTAAYIFLYTFPVFCRKSVVGSCKNQTQVLKNTVILFRLSFFMCTFAMFFMKALQFCVLPLWCIRSGLPCFPDINTLLP